MVQRQLTLAGAACVLLALVVGCSTGAKSTVASSQAAGTPGSPAPDPRFGTDRKLIYTADLVVRVGDTSKSTQRATAVTTDAGGVVFASEANVDGKNETRLTLKVPSARFQDALDRLSSLGRVLRRQAKAQDVTDQVVDLEGRLKTAQASADRLRGLLASAGSPADIAAVEGELAKREAEIESMQGRLRVLDDQVDLSTISLTLTERASLQVNDDLPGFLKSLRAGAVALVNVALVLVAVAGFLVPFAPFLALGWWLVRRYRRRHPRPQRPSGPQWSPGGGPPPAPPSEPAGKAPEAHEEAKVLT